MSNFVGVGIFWIGLNRADLGCWRLTLTQLQVQLALTFFFFTTSKGNRKL